MPVTVPTNSVTAPPPIAGQGVLFLRRHWPKVVLLGLAGVLLVEIVRVTLGSNLHTVIPGSVYRGAALSPADLEAIVRKYGIRTVVNLRGLCNPFPWYLDQCRTVQKLGINQEDICFSAERLPHAQELRRLVEIFDRAERPLFLHCRRGSDRTGIAAAVLLLLRDDVTIDHARGALHWRYGHVPVAGTEQLDEFLKLYEEWLARENLTHAPDVLRRWVRDEYRGGWCQYEIEEFTPLSTPMRAGAPGAYRLVLRNTGPRTWHIRQHKYAGIHVGFRVQLEDGRTILEERSGLVHADVAPGETFATLIELPYWMRPGRYRLTVDMIDEAQGWFYQMGSRPLRQEIEIRE